MSSEHHQIPHDVALQPTISVKNTKYTHVYIDYNLQKEANEVGEEKVWKKSRKKTRKEWGWAIT